MGSVSSPKLGGILVALATTWTDDGKAIDKNRLKEHIDRIFDAGCHGIVPAGTTGEFTAMSLNERKQLIELCVEYTAGRGFVVAGTGATNTQDAVELAEHAAKAGASALMVVPPFYDPVDYEQAKELFSEIHKSSGLDIVYYNVPQASGLKLSPVEIAGLSKHGVKYLKDSSGDATAFTDLVFSQHEHITAFNGADCLTFYGLVAGCTGSVWGASNIFPELSAQLWETIVVKKDVDGGRELWRKIYPICEFLERYNYPSAVKTGMELRGWKTGGLRKPFKLLPAEPRAELAEILRKAGIKVVE